MEVNSPATHNTNSIGASFPTEGFQVTITRKSQYMDQHIPMQILINGASASHLKNGESRTYLITEDQAELQASLAMNKTAPYRLTAQAGNLQHFYVASRMTNLIFILGTILVVASAGLVLWTQDLIYMIIAAPAALYHMYLRFIHKDKYLIIRQGTGR
jgi:hypothetical protein